MANRLANKLKNLNLKSPIGNPSIPKGTIVIDLTDDQIEELGHVEPGELLRSNILSGASKIAVVASTMECAYKAAAFTKMANSQGLEAALEMFKPKYGASENSNSIEDAKTYLDDVLEELQEQEKELNKSTSGGNGDKEDDNDETEE